MTVDETFRQLDALLSADAAKRARNLEGLKAITQRLDGGLLPADEPMAQDGRPSRVATSQARPFVPLPQRTTHGGRFGPAVRAKLEAEALGRRR